MLGQGLDELGGFLWRGNAITSPAYGREAQLLGRIDSHVSMLEYGLRRGGGPVRRHPTPRAKAGRFREPGLPRPALPVCGGVVLAIRGQMTRRFVALVTCSVAALVIALVVPAFPELFQQQTGGNDTRLVAIHSLMTRAEARAAVGAPNRVGARGTAECWFYGPLDGAWDLNLCFREGRLAWWTRVVSTPSSSSATVGANSRAAG
jgi:hypothetical protein